MTIYTLLADIDEHRIQSPHELGSVWGEIRDEIEQLGGDIKHSYVMLGNYDLQIIFDADHEDAVFQITMAVQRHGLKARTLRSVPIDRLGDLVDDQ